ncbi:MAG TPA: 2-C-methyl-D-erythritol 4-phosphate cytidylyltransferase [Ideonella sp.]|uniref:2-C-methyl-D-erythritol 4-phosphate cytidylyltransferase n=1 Tax=Ideonella sp. TaxID=1929293 RepID=UPI002C9050BE|nr:2-C-methyl-D-erythritol 4-phosphate cytidylyltransferase [Ideonella sp.]HSI49499.1 2-C-methyl-D-erythritol 4-phosphate cytidylyltransferase [Ideonella sp.]
MNPMTIGSVPRCFALVPCAGAGRRAGSHNPKQYEPVAGRPLVAHTLAALAGVARIEATLVVLAPDDEQFDDEFPGLVGDRLWTAKVGGATRAETVANGLAELKMRGVQPHDWVLVHDAARCLIRAEWVDRLIDNCHDDEVGGLLALPLADTLKADMDGDVHPEARGRVQATVPRDGKWAAQTPQMFRLGLLSPALAAADPAQITDEASAVEALGHQPLLVRGDYENFKVTWPGDFALAERLLASVKPGPEARAFVPAKDFELSQRFYADIGFTQEFAHGNLAGFKLGDTGFLLQDFYEPQHAANFMMHLTLDDLDAFWRTLQQNDIIGRYQVRVEAPEQRPWGLVDMVLFDPSGVLWRIAQRMETPA